VKKMARLVLFFGSWFLVLFLFTTGMQCLEIWDNMTRFVPIPSGGTLSKFISIAWDSLPLALYSVLLLALSYASRRRIPVFLNRLVLFVLALSLTLGIALGLSRLSNGFLPEGEEVPVTLGKPGLVVSVADTVIVLLEDPAQKDGSRVVSIPGRPLIYQEVPRGPENTIPDLPPILFYQEESVLLNSLFIDISLTAKQFHTRIQEGLVPFTVYAGALIFLLVSLGFVMNLSVWPLANLFFGALIFRGILALESFLNFREIQGFIASFLGNRLPEYLISPVVFINIGILLILYDLVSFFAWGRRVKREN
jgi:hypothetical protein